MNEQPIVTDTTLVFNRTPVARLVSCAASFGSAALFFDYLSRGAGRIQILPLIGIGFLVIGSILSALLQYGDHIYVTPVGVLYENRLLPIMGRKPRLILWQDVVEVREIRDKILVLFSADGRRMMVDAIAGYSYARREILRRVPQAALSGTLATEHRS